MKLNFFHKTILTIHNIIFNQCVLPQDSAKDKKQYTTRYLALNTFPRRHIHCCKTPKQICGNYWRMPDTVFLGKYATLIDHLPHLHYLLKIMFPNLDANQLQGDRQENEAYLHHIQYMVGRLKSAYSSH